MTARSAHSFSRSRSGWFLNWWDPADTPEQDCNMAQIRADEITRVLREEIENYERAINVAETGFVISVGDGIARVYGLETVMAGELVEFPHNVSGIALNLEEDQVGVVMLGDYTEIREG